MCENSTNEGCLTLMTQQDLLAQGSHASTHSCIHSPPGEVVLTGSRVSIGQNDTMYTVLDVLYYGLYYRGGWDTGLTSNPTMWKCYDSFGGSWV